MSLADQGTYHPAWPNVTTRHTPIALDPVSGATVFLPAVRYTPFLPLVLTS